jgi:predicted DNA-binding antitoxin AbrB/MazE fold protein
MTTTLKAIYEQGVLRLERPISLPDGAQVDVIVVSRDKHEGERAEDMESRSWDALTQLSSSTSAL